MTPEKGGVSLLHRAENTVSIAILCAMALLPILEIVGRWLWRTGIPGSTMLVQHGTLWIGFLGGAIAARDGRLQSIGTIAGLFPEGFRKPASVFSASVSASVSLLLAYAGVTLVRIEWADGSVAARDPEDQELELLLRLAERLGARVQGEDGETYLGGGRIEEA